ncbi:MAG: DUF2905 domain-containing protein [Clostridia bacterium]|nr:DUF2905 domain-containing protein [Clostridia bacterium]MBC7345941.1 DUF2905 domain-containing protein [Clostridia bacterium]
MAGQVRLVGEWSWLGRALVLMGALLVLFGLVLWLGPRLWPFGRLPGDIYYQKGQFTLYFPLVTCLIVSLVLTLLLNLFLRR